MTVQHTRPKATAHPRFVAVSLSLLLFFMFALMLRRADIAAHYTKEGLALCARAILPSLFPFMVLAELLVATGAGEWLALPLPSLLGKILGLSRAGCCAVLLGLLCGFPVGARCAIMSYEKGRIGRDECERILACSSIPSAAFLISTIGTTLWKNAKFGITLYISAVLSAILSGILLYGMQKQQQENTCPISQSHSVDIRFEAGMFPLAIRNATINTLLICAYVVFFSALAGTIEIVLGRFSANETMHAIIESLLELSGGVNAASMISNQKLAKILTGATVGWSGISVHCQMLSLCDGHNISTRPYLIAKLVQAVICAIAMWALFLLDIFY